MSLWVTETYVNATKGHGFGDSGQYESFTDNAGELYRSLQAEFGRCVGRMFVDLPDKPAVPCGWVFQGRQRYEDTGEPYLREVWVHVFARPDTVTRMCHHYDITKGQEA